MKLNNIKILSAVVLICLLSINSVFSQQNNIFLSEKAWEGNLINPAIVPKDGRFFIGLPTLSVKAYNSGPTANQVLTDIGNGYQFNNISALANLNDKNTFTGNLDFSLFNVGFRHKKWTYSIGMENINQIYASIPKDLGILYFEGNGNYVGDTLEIGPSVAYNNYRRFFAGGTYQLGKLSLGLRLNYLAGIANFSSKGSDRVGLYTSPEAYQLTFVSDYQINTNFQISDSVLVNNGFSDVVKQLFFKNKGFSMDLGATYTINDKIKVGAGVNNLFGAINWKTATNFTSKGTFYYEGIEVENILDDSISFVNFLDTTYQRVKPVETYNDYSSSLPVSAHVFANYYINQKWSVNGMLALNSYRNTNIGTVAIGAMYKPLKWLELGTSYSIQGVSNKNLGFSLAFSSKSVRAFLFTDNINAYFKLFDSRNINLRTGISIVL